MLPPIKSDSVPVQNNTTAPTTGNTVNGSFSVPTKVTGSTAGAPWSSKFANLINTSIVVPYNFQNVTLSPGGWAWASCWSNTEEGHETWEHFVTDDNPVDTPETEPVDEDEASDLDPTPSAGTLETRNRIWNYPGEPYLVVTNPS